MPDSNVQHKSGHHAEDTPDPKEDPARTPKLEDRQLGGPAPGPDKEEPEFRDSHPPSGSHRAEERRGDRKA